ncbi:unnamed protein product [Lymnaea stagnalis]|uniref:C2H2-type domain-containing protein n=1 Tax=Lymnaea stagnalis TaxID=6523 RepID=A0AAV2HN66_LYMST
MDCYSSTDSVQEPLRAINKDLGEPQKDTVTQDELDKGDESAAKLVANPTSPREKICSGSDEHKSQICGEQDTGNESVDRGQPETSVSQNQPSTSHSRDTPNKNTEKPAKFKCPKCLCVMKDRRLIDNHSCDSETDEEKVKITIMLDKDTKSFLCQECDFSSAGHGFEEHLMCHLMVRPYQCLYCKECFINRKEISRHVHKSHNGAKMSCALRALRKAKALIKEVTLAGVLSFMAKVAGKVPLEKDPERKKKIDNVPNADSKDRAVDSASDPAVDINGSNIPDKSSLYNDGNVSVDGSGDKTVPSASVGDGLADDVSDSVVGSPMNSARAETVQKQQSQGFSKLRQVLTSGVSELAIQSSPKGKDGSNKLDSVDDSGLKIVASYSLQDSDGMDTDKVHCSSPRVDMEPNFIIESSNEEKEPELLSFLGPEQPMYKAEPTCPGLMLPPPPLHPAPSHLNNSNSSSPTSQVAKQQVKDSNFFICGLNCLFSCLSTAEFKEHTMNFHSSETYFPCYYCGHRSPNENDLVRHISNHTHTHNKSSPLYVCGNDGCRFGTNMLTDYINHIKLTHPEILEPLCYACGVVFTDLLMLQNHVEDNVIHSINCPHCPSKATDRRVILNHITSAHPGKPKMVSVAKQLICNDRKVNGYEQMKHLQEMQPPTLTPAPGFAGDGCSSVVDQILSRHETTKTASGTCLSEILSAGPSSRDTPSPSSRMATPPSTRKKSGTPESGKSPNSDGSDLCSLRVKDEIDDDVEDELEGSGATDEATTVYSIDENGIRRRIYVPMSERQAENYKCRYCTFIARDLKRLNCHERSHGMPPTRKERFKCMFCPQGFDSEMKFRLHITCHPGLIKFLLYRCKKCEFDTNQKHTIVKHITCNRDRKHRGFGPVEDQYSVVSRSLESRVLECERCDYMTRHKIHMAIHYQRKHNILRDKGEFTIESLTPTDTPLSSYDLSPRDSGSSPSFHPSLQSPDNSSCDGMFDFTKPSGSAKKAKEKATVDMPHLTPTQINERNELFNKMVSQQAALQPGQVLENQMRKFKCPICKYLLPKAADLKNHVKRHSEIGQITLTMFRCKYCSCMSTARELLYDHLSEKHPGKPIALVKKIVAIDTTEVDRSFAETSMEESLDLLEESLHKEIMTCLKKPGSSPSKPQKSSAVFEQLFVIPEGGETFSAALQCPKCSYSSHNKTEIVQHVNSFHSEVKVISSDEDVDKLARATSEDLRHAKVVTSSQSPTKHSLTSQEEVLIVPDEQVFKEASLCSRCDFSTMLRRDMVIHLQQCHPDISVMGRNSYPVQVSTMGRKIGLMEESCVVGSGSLDAKIRCLYENYGTQMKCLICGTERPKKFFIHVHILRHLNIYLWKCAFCAHRGLQKYKMVDHIKKIHPGKAMSVRYIRVNVETKVAQFLQQFNVIKNRKANLDEGRDVPYASPSYEDSMDQTSNDSVRSRQKSPGPGGTSGSSTNSLGSEELDDKIRFLYDYSDGVFYKCIACSNQFQRKFAVHRHIIISHLKVALLACGYCGLEGVEKHQLVDHILACHKSSPVNIQTLAVDLSQKVSDFLAKVAAGELHSASGDADQSEINAIMRGLSSTDSITSYVGNSFKHVFKTQAGSKKKKLLANKLAKYKGPSFKLGNKLPPGVTVKKHNSVDPDVLMLGRDALDRELGSLYQLKPTGQFRCLICRWEFPRKYPLHRHIMLKHLKMNLVGCPYCPFEGVEKYNVSAHIKEEHGGQPINIKYSQPDVGGRVRKFVNDLANLGGNVNDLIRKPNSRDGSPLVIPKTERQDDEEDDDDRDEMKGTAGSSQKGLVVAMFGKKKKPAADEEFVVKTEIDEEQCEEGKIEEFDDFIGNHEDDYNEDDYNEDDDPGADKSNYDPSDESAQSFSTLRRPLKESYAPGAYRSPAGGKPKALDVITKIKVLKAREGPITKFYCEQCKFTSLHRSNIVRHIYKIHEKYQTHTCPVCNYQTLSLMLMQKHVDKEHPGVAYKEDAFTLNPPRSKPRKIKPLMGPLSFQRNRQKLISKKLASAKPMNVSTSSQGPKQYACAYCHYETNTQEDILQHTRENHSQRDESSSPAKNTQQAGTKPDDHSSACWDGSKKAVKRKIKGDVDDNGGVVKRRKRFVFEKGDELIQCGYCDSRETSMSRIQDHMTWDHPGLPFEAKRIPAWRFICKSCSVKTMATSKMKYHLNRHVNYRPFTCTNCGAFFPSPDQCRRHSRSQGHEEQYMYVRNVKKENKVEELLEGTRQLALKIQEEAAKDADFNIGQTDSFIAKFQDTSINLKRSAPTGSKNAKKSRSHSFAEDGGTGVEGSPVKKQHGKSPQTVGIEMDVTVKCYRCDFTASNVNDVKTHHNEAHDGERFLWTELDRGFTCDGSGEALPDCDSVPSSSLDVGYTTRMTLGSGNSPMRFKCKTCDFSSCVIQAMKSHLKSHQPKGFICPYCSRSFSGKEKLMRHQYCLHKGQPLWVIHLRRSGVVGSTNTTKGKANKIVKIEEDIKPFGLDALLLDTHLASQENLAVGNNSQVITYLCSECTYASESLYHFRLHIAQQHEQFQYKMRDTSANSPLKCELCSFLAETEAEHHSHMEGHSHTKYLQCGYCEFCADDDKTIHQHLSSKHGSLEAKIIELGTEPQSMRQNFKGNEKRALPLLVNLSPQVLLYKVPEAVLSQYGCLGARQTSEDEAEDDFALVAELEAEDELFQEGTHGEDVEEEDEERLMVVEGISEDMVESDLRSSDGSNLCGETEDISLDMISNADNSDSEMNPETYSENLEMHLGLADKGQSSSLESDSDMMIMQFGGINADNTSSRNKDLPETTGETTMDVTEKISISRSKDSTLLSAQQNTEDIYHHASGDDDDDDEDDDLEEVNFENDITLASPLPMISLGDGVAMDDDDDRSNSSLENSSSELLLDV